MSDKVYKSSCERTNSGVFLRLDDETGKLSGIRCPYYDSKAKPAQACRVAGKNIGVSGAFYGYESGRCIMVEKKMFEV